MREDGKGSRGLGRGGGGEVEGDRLDSADRRTG